MTSRGTIAAIRVDSRRTETCSNARETSATAGSRNDIS
jgi:hypothetical protein